MAGQRRARRAGGINYLEAIQLPTLASLYGALLARGPDDVLMAANTGVPARIPALPDELVDHRAVTISVTVEGSERGQQHQIAFDPARIADPNDRPQRLRPNFLAIVSPCGVAQPTSRDLTCGLPKMIRLSYLPLAVFDARYLSPIKWETAADVCADADLEGFRTRGDAGRGPLR